MLLVLIISGMLAAPALGQNSEAKVKIRGSASKANADGIEQIKIDIDIDKGWHIYANPPKHKSFESSKTVVRFVSPRTEEVTIEYPEGRIKKDRDPVDGEFEYRVYEGSIRINAHLKRVEARPLEAHIQVYACDDKQCLPRGIVKIKIP
jgi:hypothetical protein